MLQGKGLHKAAPAGCCGRHPQIRRNTFRTDGKREDIIPLHTIMTGLSS